MTKHNCCFCNSTISEDWLEVSEGVNNTGECYDCFQKQQQGRQLDRFQANDFLGREDQTETPERASYANGVTDEVRNEKERVKNVRKKN